MTGHFCYSTYKTFAARDCPYCYITIEHIQPVEFTLMPTGEICRLIPTMTVSWGESRGELQMFTPATTQTNGQ